MPVPFPTDDDADRSRPTKDEAWLNARAFASAAAPAEGLTQLQAFALRGLTIPMRASVPAEVGWPLLPARSGVIRVTVR